ncbi:MAG: methyltransferase domain-containing protein [Candidatus Thorarchaeota archaeon]|nr:MAG: methyltransferase domain-containing protein [Candidatus Thorarchaeota archaeon]
MGAAEFNRKLYEERLEEDPPDYQFEFFRVKRLMMLSMIDNEPEKILELGCAGGWLGEKLKRKFKAEVHGVDISPNALRLAENRGLIAKEFDLDGNRWPYEDNTFDVVIAGDLLEHLFDTETVVAEAYRVLRQGGLFIVSAPNINCYYNRLWVLFGKLPYWIESAPNLVFVPLAKDFGDTFFNPGHIRVFNKESLTKLLEHFEFEVELIRGVPLGFTEEETPKRFRFLRRMAQGVENYFSRIPTLSSLILAKAVKR